MRPGQGPDGDDRAARAFEDAFRRADAEPFAPWDPADLVAQEVRRRPVRPRTPVLALAAAVTAALILPLGVVLMLRPPGPAGTTAGAPPAAASDAAREAGANSEGSAGGGTREAAGVRTEQLPGGVTVEVPASWGRAAAPWSDWCASGRAFPSAPYVGEPPPVVAAIACPDPIPADRLATHLTWVSAGTSPEVYGLPDGWRRVERTLGALTLVVVVPESELAVADAVLASARG